jgi:hypothetical protein
MSVDRVLKYTTGERRPVSEHVFALMEPTPDGRRLWQVAADLQRELEIQVDRVFGVTEERPFGHVPTDELRGLLAEAEADLVQLDNAIAVATTTFDRVVTEPDVEVTRMLAEAREQEAAARAAEERRADELWPAAKAWLGWEWMQ